MSFTYHISTAIIIDNFRNAKLGDCPICKIKKEVEKRIVEQFCGEAVMIDEYRKIVNKKGFCKKHFLAIAATDNALGTSLQARTRFKTLLDETFIIPTQKNAKSVASKIVNATKTCTICDMAQDNIQRYLKYIPKFFANDNNFEKLLKNAIEFEPENELSFCLPHYANLIEAGANNTDFLQTIYQLQNKSVLTILNDLDKFANKFDYRNKDIPLGTAKNIISRSINKMHSED